MRFSYLVVEGTHDVAFIGRILRTFGLSRVINYQALQPFWVPVIPTKFPYQDDLVARAPVPAFFDSAEHSVAVNSAIGVSRLVRTLQITLAQLGSSWRELRSIGMFLDADWSREPSDLFAELRPNLEQFDLVMPVTPGTVAQGNTRTGIYIFPDNRGPGTLENVLDECAMVAYPGLRDAGRSLVESIDQTRLTPKDLQELRTPSGEVKSVIGCISKCAEAHEGDPEQH